jgi:hypothetical protein
MTSVAPAAGGAADDRPDPLRQRIAAEAARSVAAGSDTRRAVFRAARRVAHGWVPDDRLPTAAEVQGTVHHTLDPASSLAHLVGDRFDRIAALVGLLVTVRQNPATHPEGDALEHALQVFDLVHAERPFDEELLTAALVHEVGRVIDRDDAVAAGIEALGDLITPRTRWFVESLDAARGYEDRTLGRRARHRLEAHPDFEDVLLLAAADRKGRVRGHAAPTLEDAITILRALDDDGRADGTEAGA